MKTEKTIIDKQKSHAFRKDVYLLGTDQDGIKYWLESPSWDCGWYWGFGYVETYENNRNPDKANDINSHQHIDSTFMGQKYQYDWKTSQYKKLDYVHNLFDSPVLTSVTFTESEGWKLSELFNQFYLLKEMADFCHKDKPGCHTTTSPVDHGNLKEWSNQINTVMIPKITAEIISILSPKEVKK